MQLTDLGKELFGGVDKLVSFYLSFAWRPGRVPASVRRNISKHYIPLILGSLLQTDNSTITPGPHSKSTAHVPAPRFYPSHTQPRDGPLPSCA